MGESLILISLDYKRDFLIFPFSLEHTIATVLLQKNDDGFEQAISFCNKFLRDCELKYNIMEKKAYALIKSIKSFREYLLSAYIIAFIPNGEVKENLCQPWENGRWSK